MKIFPPISGGAYTISILQEITAVHEQFHDPVDWIKFISSGEILFYDWCPLDTYMVSIETQLQTRSCFSNGKQSYYIKSLRV